MEENKVTLLSRPGLGTLFSLHGWPSWLPIPPDKMSLPFHSSVGRSCPNPASFIYQGTCLCRICWRLLELGLYFPIDFQISGPIIPCQEGSTFVCGPCKGVVNCQKWTLIVFFPFRCIEAKIWTPIVMFLKGRLGRKFYCKLPCPRAIHVPQMNLIHQIV